ncbi:Uncharacterised protein [uncultured archaeon]|nr:Uncharacterised protein [uncultured archaeon]
MLQRALKCAGQKNGQASIEFLLVLSAALAFLSASLLMSSELSDSALLFISAFSAKAFSSEVASAADSLSLLAEGSSMEISASIPGEWKIERGGTDYFLAVSAGNRESRIMMSPAVVFPVNVSGKAGQKLSIVLEKRNGIVIASVKGLKS